MRLLPFALRYGLSIARAERPVKRPITVERVGLDEKTVAKLNEYKLLTNTLHSFYFIHNGKRYIMTRKDKLSHFYLHGMCSIPSACRTHSLLNFTTYFLDKSPLVVPKPAGFCYLGGGVTKRYASSVFFPFVTTYLPRPFCFATYIAASASWTRSSTVRASVG